MTNTLGFFGWLDHLSKHDRFRIPGASPVGSRHHTAGATRMQSRSALFGWAAASLPQDSLVVFPLAGSGQDDALIYTVTSLGFGFVFTRRP